MYYIAGAKNYSMCINNNNIVIKFEAVIEI